MAITVALTLEPEGVSSNQLGSLKCVVSNSGSSDVTVSEAETFIYPTGGVGSTAVSATIGRMGPPIGNPNKDPIVPASGSLTLRAGVVLFDVSADKVGNICENKYNLSARIWTSDGSVTDATAEVTLTQLDQANESQRALLRFDQSDRSGYAALPL